MGRIHGDLQASDQGNNTGQQALDGAEQSAQDGVKSLQKLGDGGDFVEVREDGVDGVRDIL